MRKPPIKAPLLVNAWEKAKAHPDRFEVPHISVLRNLRAGDFVKFATIASASGCKSLRAEPAISCSRAP
jgi:hypothetical protein